VARRRLRRLLQLDAEPAPLHHSARHPRLHRNRHRRRPPPPPEPSRRRPEGGSAQAQPEIGSAQAHSRHVGHRRPGIRRLRHPRCRHVRPLPRLYRVGQLSGQGDP